MSKQARITSIDALEVFRAHLIDYLGRARVAIDDVGAEIRRTGDWLAHDCPRHWLGQIKLAEKLLAQAEQELFSVNLTAPEAHHAARKQAVQKARRRLAAAREKLHVAKQWQHRFGPRVESLVNQLHPMEAQIGHHLPAAVQLLTESIKALQDYTGTATAPVAPPPPPA